MTSTIKFKFAQPFFSGVSPDKRSDEPDVNHPASITGESLLASSVRRALRNRVLFLMLLLPLSGRVVWAGAEIEKDTRLSRWLTEYNSTQNTYYPGLVWMVPEEAVIQKRIKIRLLDQIGSQELAPGVARRDAQGLADFIAAFPVTGRVVIEKTDGRWLVDHPQQNPLLKKGQSVAIPLRPTSVTVVKGDGTNCQVTHSVKAYAADYARSCGVNGSPRVAWVVQPDGLIQRVGMATWNANDQNPPAPGAWVVVADASIPWPDEIMEQVARVLATQGVAEDQPGHILQEPPAGRGLLEFSARPRDIALTSNDWGMIGLMQTPTARMESAGNANINVTQVAPYTRMTGSMQLMDWFGLSVRWTDISNRAYWASLSQSYKDKSVDFKFKLLNESALLPQVAMGISDLGGTGLFSSEYVVTNKRTGDFDWSLGLGWGYLGSRGNLANPLSVLSSAAAVRPAPNVGLGGTVSTSTMFRGPTALFGGVQYQTPWESLILKLEYDGNNYQKEPMNNPQRQSSPINAGLVYRWNPGVDLSVSFERGNTLGVGLNIHGDLSRFTVPKLSDPQAELVQDFYPEQEPDWKQVAALLEQKTSWHVLKIKREGSEVVVRFQNADAANWNGYVDRVVSVLHKYVPGKNILVFRIQSEDKGLRLHEFQIDRHAWVAAHTSYIPAHHKSAVVFERTEFDGYNYSRSPLLVEKSREKFSSSAGLFLDHAIGGPEGVLYRMGLGTRGNWSFRPDTWWTGTLQLVVLDNYNKFINPPSLSTLPPVRTQVQRYVASQVNMPVFQLTHVGKLNANNFYSVYGGMFESMYGGVGGEWLYRPWQSPVSFGVDINAVQQRGFAQDFSFQTYKALTGHISLYWETGFEDINATLRAGKYLARDLGATLDLSRSFNNGVKMGAYATKTNVTAAQFGEGSFDKGVYLNIPFDALLTRSSSDIASIIWHPLTRDGGAMLHREFRLFDLTKGQGGDLLKLRPWSDERTTQFGDAADTLHDINPGRSVFASAKSDLMNAASLTTTSSFWESMLWMGGITLASSVLDKPADRFAVKHGAGPSMKGVESFGNMLPFVALGASGIAFLGAEPDRTLSTTAYSSLAAGGIGLASTLGMKYIIGRDRPLVGTGTASFNLMSANNGNASMPSGHTTIMWAAITPYAKEYDAPWLYGLAAITNVARIGGRNHWFSDTVAGSLFGYAIGDFVYQSHHNAQKRGMNWSISPNGVSAYWKID